MVCEFRASSVYTRDNSGERRSKLVQPRGQGFELKALAKFNVL